MGQGAGNMLLWGIKFKGYWRMSAGNALWHLHHRHQYIELSVSAASVAAAVDRAATAAAAARLQVCGAENDEATGMYV